MNPEERRLLERTLKLTEENHKILQNVEKRARRAAIYGFIKLAIIILPFVLGYIFLEPYFNEARDQYSGMREMLNSLSR